MPEAQLAERFYRLNDVARGGLEEVPLSDACSFNQNGWGIFHAVNFFQPGLPRKNANLAKIRAWYVDIDGGDKPSMRERIKALSLIHI